MQKLQKYWTDWVEILTWYKIRIKDGFYLLFTIFRGATLARKFLTFLFMDFSDFWLHIRGQLAKISRLKKKKLTGLAGWPGGRGWNFGHFWPDLSWALLQSKCKIWPLDSAHVSKRSFNRFVRYRVPVNYTLDYRMFSGTIIGFQLLSQFRTKKAYRCFFFDNKFVFQCK